MRSQPNGRSAPATPATTSIPGTAIVTTWELIDADLAASYLAENGANRKLMLTLAARYAKDMQTAQWFATHQGVCFDQEGKLIDGQHRLEAIRLAGEPQWLLVTRGLPAQSVEAIDRGKARSIAHSLQILGYEHSDHKTVAMVRAMYCGPVHVSTEDRPTDITLRKFIDAHIEAVTIVSLIPGRHRLPAPVTGALCRATYHAKPADLGRFVLAYRDEIGAEHTRKGDLTARQLAKAAESKSVNNSGGQRTGLYRKAQNAIRAYLDGIDLQKLYECADDLFPLPDAPAAEGRS